MSRICSLFSGIGGFEAAFSRAGFSTVLMSEIDPVARAILRQHFPDVTLRRDVTKMHTLPSCEVLAAGWPCQDLSQAGRTAGIGGAKSALVSEVFRLIAAAKRKPEYVVLENVAFALHLQNGSAINYVVKELEELGYRWAYRILDTRYFGLPQRRRRLYIVASRVSDPCSILFDSVDSDPGDSYNGTLTGFYWTEGNTGLGWSPGFVPPLKGGSGLSIPSPPAIWNRELSTFSVPSILDAERLQGFRGGWTKYRDSHISEGARWRLVGNAVSVPVAEWIAKKINVEANDNCDISARSSKRPNAAFGGPKSESKYFHAPEMPQVAKRVTLEQFGLKGGKPLSNRAAKGFYQRISRSSLRTEPQFIADLAAYVK